MQKQRNAVEKSYLELSENIKSLVDQRLYAALGESKVERTQAQKIIAVVNAAIDESYGRSSKHFDKSVEALVVAVREDSRPKDSKSAKK
jgi:hypothetical protein